MNPNAQRYDDDQEARYQAALDRREAEAEAAEAREDAIRADWDDMDGLVRASVNAYAEAGAVLVALAQCDEATADAIAALIPDADGVSFAHDLATFRRDIAERVQALALQRYRDAQNDY